MRSNICSRRLSTTPSQLEDYNFINHLLSSDTFEGNYAYDDQLNYDNDFGYLAFPSTTSNETASIYPYYRTDRRDSIGSTSSNSSSNTNTTFYSIRHRSNIVSSLTNPNIDDAIEAIAVMTVHEISTSIYNPTQSIDVESQLRSSSSIRLTQENFESLWSVFHKIGLKDFDGSILHLHRIPETWEVAEFLRHLYTVTKFSPECFIIAMIYISRILNNPHCVILTSCTWRPLFFSCLLVAHKYWDDDYLANQDFVQGYPSHLGFEANRLERTILQLLEYRVGVLPSAYARSYFGLRAAMMLVHEKSFRRQFMESSFGSSSARSSVSTEAGSTVDGSPFLPLHEAEHTELRRDLLHIIHGAECTCQRPRERALCTGESSRPSIGDRSVLVQAKISWPFPVRQAGQFLRRALTRATGSGRRNTVDITDGIDVNRSPPCTTFHRSIITMALHPYLHHGKSDDGIFANRIQNHTGSENCISDEESRSFEVGSGTPQLSNFIPSVVSSAPPYRRSLSFESLPTLKKGLRLNTAGSQPPIIGHGEPQIEQQASSTEYLSVYEDEYNDKSYDEDTNEMMEIFLGR